MTDIDQQVRDLRKDDDAKRAAAKASGNYAVIIDHFGDVEIPISIGWAIMADRAAEEDGMMLSKWVWWAIYTAIGNSKSDPQQFSKRRAAINAVGDPVNVPRAQ